jgi:hypothetical protein
MSTNYYSDYYQNQAQSGQTQNNHQVGRGQRGLGFKSFMSGLVPYFKSAGKTLLNTGVGIGADIFQGKNVLDTLKTRGIDAAKDLAVDACDELRLGKAQRGSGVRRTRKLLKKTKKCKTRKCLKKRSKTLSASLVKLLSSRKYQKKTRKAPAKRKR